MVNTFKEVYDINVKINKIDAKDFCDRTLSTINKDFLNKKIKKSMDFKIIFGTELQH